MSYIDGVPAEDWIEENRPKNGWYRVYWSLPKKLIFHEKLIFWAKTSILYTIHF